ncbi:unnamed protein product [Vicia faba]|uniref:K Homology domain-containing protein n=1 Tax=Vicia faba TaxID=3906 RepID=A0AAV0ZA07_VICFA|nr:unnamed protein product [Vicia faba]
MQDPTSAAVETDHHQPPPPSPYKRNTKTKRPVFKVLPGQIAFRLVCHSSTVGGLIGSSGSIVSQLRRETGCKIHCEDAVDGTDDRVILVIGSLLPRKGFAVGDGELQVGAVVGKGGKNISTIRNNTGTKIRVCPAPHSAAKDEELVLITGERLAVKKGLISVSHCLQDCPPMSKVSLNTPTVSYLDRPICNPHEDLFPHVNSWLPSMEGLSINDTSKQMINSNGNFSLDSKGTTGHEVVFRLLCSNNVAGSVIGKKGSIVRTFECQTGASIVFAPPLNQFEDRVITISAFENLESSNSPAQDAVILVFARIVEDHIRNGFHLASSAESPVTARLLVAPSIVNFLTGNEGQVISELREVSGAGIQILHGVPVPNGASDNDVVVQITGGYKCVENALRNFTSRIRGNSLPNEVLAEARMKSSFQVNKDIVRSKFISRRKSAFPFGRFPPQNAGMHAKTTTENGDNLNRDRGNMLATVTNTTVEIIVSEHVFASVYGEDGGNLDQIRQISGANVTVYDPSVGTSGGKVVISGTPDQTFAAQSLLQAFIQTAQVS